MRSEAASISNPYQIVEETLIKVAANSHLHTSRSMEQPTYEDCQERGTTECITSKIYECLAVVVVCFSLFSYLLLVVQLSRWKCLAVVFREDVFLLLFICYWWFS